MSKKEIIIIGIVILVLIISSFTWFKSNTMSKDQNEIINSIDKNRKKRCQS